MTETQEYILVYLDKSNEVWASRRVTARSHLDTLFEPLVKAHWPTNKIITKCFVIANKPIVTFERKEVIERTDQ